MPAARKDNISKNSERIPETQLTNEYTHHSLCLIVFVICRLLQDLQNEVAALLEFRDLVIETFPDLKSKMASSAANSTLTGLPSTSSLGSR